MRQGFTLLETAIVLAIMGLVAGGIMLGKDMIDNAKLSSVIADVQRYEVAVQSFKEKYDQLPGDMVDAHDHWDDGADGVCGTAAECNGNGDGNIGYAGVDAESFRAWQHLVLGGFMQGEFSGVGGTGSEALEPGINAPLAPIAPGIFMLGYSAPLGTLINLGTADPDTTNDAFPMEVVLTPRDAYTIDAKIDDGMPLLGRVYGLSGWEVRKCYDGMVSPETYEMGEDIIDLEGNGVGCMMQFGLDLD